jgi:hypothetical protein
MSKWIQGAIKHKSSLRKALGIKKGKNIPASELEVSKSDSPLMKRRKILAKTLSMMRHK